MEIEIINVLTWVMNSITSVQKDVIYSDTDIKGNINSTLLSAQKELSKYIKWDTLTVKDCEELRFGRWANDDEIKEEIEYITEKKKKKEISEEEFKKEKERKLNTKNLMLIPVWLYPIIPIGIELIDIFGNKVINNGHNISGESRRGCIGYGIIPKESH